MSEHHAHKHLEPADREHRAHLEHENLLQTWDARDAVRAKTLAIEHINGPLADLRRQLSR